MILSIRVLAALLLFLFTFTARASALVTVPDNETVSADGSAIYALSSDVTSKDVVVGSNVTVTAASSTASHTNLAAGLFALGEGASIDAADNLKVITEGDYVRGLIAEKGGVIEIGASADITTSGHSAHGVFARAGSRVTIGDTATIITSGGSAHGLYLFDNASIDAGDRLTITTTGNDGRGIEAVTGAKLNIGDWATITTSGDVGYGIHSWGSYVNVGDNLTISTRDRLSYGAHAWYNGASMDIGDSAVITTAGNLSPALYAWQDARVDIGNMAALSTSGEDSHGAYAQNNASVTVGSSADIDTSGQDSHGALAYESSGVDIGDSVTIATSGQGSHGALAYESSGVDIGNSATIATLGQDSHGAYASTSSDMRIGHSAAITTSGATARGVFAQHGSSIDIGDSAIVTTSGSRSSGIVSHNGSNVTVGDSAVIRTTGSGAHAVYSSAGSLLQLSGAEISVADMGTAAALLSDASRITGSGLFDITGYMIASDSGSSANIDLTMTDGSQFTGATMLSGNNAEINLAIDGPASTWNVIDDSDLTKLELNGSAVDFTDSALGTTITAETLGGTGGNFTMKTDVAGGVGDKLVVTGTSSGSHRITVVNDGSAETDGTEVLTLVETADSGAAFTLANDFELGAWVYSMRQIPANEGSAFQIYGAGPAGVVNTFQSHSTGLSNPASAAVNAIASGYLLGYAEMNTLIQRLGELRDTPYMSGFWARVHGGGFSIDGMSLAKEADLKYGGVHIGYDRKIETSLPGDLHAGVMFGYGKGDIDFAYADGEGDVDSKTIGVYGTYKQDDGLYVDAVLKYQWMEHGFETFDSAGTRVTTNDVESGGLGLSLEAGKRFELGNGWFVEPQAQLSYRRQDGGVFNMSNGLRLSSDGWTSLQGRLGARAGYDSGTHGFYAKVSWVKEFDGDFGFEANGEPFADSFGDSWWVYGVGYTAKLNDRNSIYIDVERASGGAFEQDWAVKAGWRIVL